MGGHFVPFCPLRITMHSNGDRSQLSVTDRFHPPYLRSSVLKRISSRGRDRQATMAVVGPDGALRGIAGLSVCDASVMPTIPCANLNVPVIMIAEKMSYGLKSRLA